MVKVAFCRLIPGVILCLPFMIVAPAVAAEATGIEILIDGKSVAGFTTTYQGESQAEIWLMLKQTPLTFERDFQVPASDADPSQATLTGQILLRTYRRGDPGTATLCDSLELVRRGNRWFVAEQDVDRTLKAAGLRPPDEPAPTPAEVSKSAAIWSLLIAAVLVVLIAFVAFRAGIPTLSRRDGQPR